MLWFILRGKLSEKKNSPKGVNRTTSESKYNREKREFISMLEKLNVFIFKVKSLIICFMFVKIQLYKHCNSQKQHIFKSYRLWKKFF